MISVGAALQCFGYEGVSGHGSHRLENSNVMNLVVVAKALNHALAGDGIILISIRGLLTGCLHETSTVRGRGAPSLLKPCGAAPYLLSNSSSQSLIAPDDPSYHSSM